MSCWDPTIIVRTEISMEGCPRLHVSPRGGRKSQVLKLEGQDEEKRPQTVQISIKLFPMLLFKSVNQEPLGRIKILGKEEKCSPLELGPLRFGVRPLSFHGRGGFTPATPGQLL